MISPSDDFLASLRGEAVLTIEPEDQTPSQKPIDKQDILADAVGKGDIAETEEINETVKQLAPPDIDNEPDNFAKPATRIEVDATTGDVQPQQIGMTKVEKGIEMMPVYDRDIRLDSPLDYAKQGLFDIAMGVGASFGNLIGNISGLVNDQAVERVFGGSDVLATTESFFSAKDEDRLAVRGEAIHDAIARGDTFEAAFRTVSGTVGDVAGNLAAFKAAFKLVGKKGLINRGAGWRSFAAQQTGRAIFGYAYAFARTGGSVEDRHNAGLLTAMYMATPIASSWSKTDLRAIGKDLIYNSIITAQYDPEDRKWEGIFNTDDNGNWMPSGQYGDAWEGAEADAEAAGNPDLFWKYFVMRAIPLVGTDVGFSLLTRSAKSNYNKTVVAVNDVRPPVGKISPSEQRIYDDYRRAAISNGLDPELANQNKPLAFFEQIADGKLSVEDLNRVYRSQGELGRVKDDFNRASPLDLRDGAEAARIGTQAQREGELLVEAEARRTIPQEQEVVGIGERVASIRDIPVTMRSVIDAMTTPEAATVAFREFASNEATLPHLRAMYDAKVTAGEIEQRPLDPVYGPITPEKMADNLARSWKPNLTPLTPQKIYELEGLLPDTTRSQVKIDAQVSHPYLSATARNLSEIERLLPVSEGMSQRAGELTKGEVLGRGISIGLSAISNDKTITPFNFLERLDQMTKSESKGGVKGFGQDSRDAIFSAWTASTPEQAVWNLNNLRIARGKAPLRDITGLERVAQVEPFGLSVEDRESALMSMSDKIPMAMKERVLENVTTPLPQDPAMREVWITSANRMGRQMAHADKRRDPRGVKSRQDSILEQSRKAQSSRYYFMNLAQDLGDYKFYDLQQRIDLESRATSATTSERLAQTLTIPSEKEGKMAKPDFRMMRWISSEPDVELAIVHKVGINPKSTNEKDVQALASADETIRNLPDKKRGRVEAVIEGIRNELQGVSAVNVRYLQLDAFEQVWKKPAFGKETLAEAWADAKASGSKDYKKAVMDEVEKHLPRRWDEEGGKVESVPVEELTRLLSIKATDGAIAARTELAMADWGTRKYYWMSEPEAYAQEVKAIGVSEVPSFSFGTPRARSATATGEIKSREGEVEFRQGSLFGNLNQHIHRLEVQARTIDMMREMKDRTRMHLKDGRISDDTFRNVNDWLDTQWGKGKVPGDVGKALIKGNAMWWTLYFASGTRAAWYSARNVIGQGTPFGHMLTQFKAGDIATAYGEGMRSLRDPTSFTGRWMEQDFRGTVSQKAIYLDEIIRSRDPAMRHYGATSGNKAFGEVKASLARWASWAAGQSDDWNRMITGAVSFQVGEKYLGKYMAGQMDYAKLEDAMLLNTLQPVQRLELVGMFDKAIRDGGTKEDFYPWLTRVADFKIENMNYVYRISGKSMLEQDPNARPLLGLMTYWRGQVEQLVKNGYEPMVNGAGGMVTSMANGKLDKQSYREFRNGIRTMVMQQVGLTAASIVGATLIGKKDEDEPMFGGPSSWVVSPFSPGGDMVLNELVTGGGDLVKEILSGDLSSSEDALEKGIDGLFFVFPILRDLRQASEAAGNYQAVDNIDVILKAVSPQNALWDRVERNAMEKLQHILFNAVKEQNTDMDEKTLGDIIIKENMIMNWLFGDDEQPALR